MKYAVKMTISGLLAGEDADGEKSQMEVDGEYFQKDRAHYLFFEEKPEGFEEILKSRIKYKDGVLELTRKGLIETRMVFEKGKQHSTRYAVPYGEVMLGVLAKELVFYEEKDRMQIRVEYELEMDGEHQSDNQIEINVRKYTMI